MEDIDLTTRSPNWGPQQAVTSTVYPVQFLNSVGSADPIINTRPTPTQAITSYGSMGSPMPYYPPNHWTPKSNEQLSLLDDMEITTLIEQNSNVEQYQKDYLKKEFKPNKDFDWLSENTNKNSFWSFLTRTIKLIFSATTNEEYSEETVEDI